MATIKTILFYCILQCLLSAGYCQLVFMVEKPGTVNNLKYRSGDRIDLKTISGERISGIINQIRDTAIVLNYYLIKNDDIAVIYTRRVIFSMFSAAGIYGGIGYVGVDGFNNLINNESEIFRKSTLKTAGFMLGTGVFLNLFTHRRRPINHKDWRIKILDFSILKDPGIYALPDNRK